MVDRRDEPGAAGPQPTDESWAGCLIPLVFVAAICLLLGAIALVAFGVSLVIHVDVAIVVFAVVTGAALWWFVQNTWPLLADMPWPALIVGEVLWIVSLFVGASVVASEAAFLTWVAAQAIMFVAIALVLRTRAARGLARIDEARGRLQPPDGWTIYGPDRDDQRRWYIKVHRGVDFPGGNYEAVFGYGDTPLAAIAALAARLEREGPLVPDQLGDAADDPSPSS